MSTHEALFKESSHLQLPTTGRRKQAKGGVTKISEKGSGRSETKGEEFFSGWTACVFHTDAIMETSPFSLSLPPLYIFAGLWDAELSGSVQEALTFAFLPSSLRDVIGWSRKCIKRGIKECAGAQPSFASCMTLTKLLWGLLIGSLFVRWK